MHNMIPCMHEMIRKRSSITENRVANEFYLPLKQPDIQKPVLIPPKETTIYLQDASLCLINLYSEER